MKKLKNFAFVRATKSSVELCYTIFYAEIITRLDEYCKVASSCIGI